MAVTGNKVKKMAEGDTLTGGSFIKFVRWVGATTAGHKAELLQNGVTGNTIFEGEATGANYTDDYPLFDYFQDVVCTDLDSGSLYIILG